ncbi:MAG: hypothetical protein IKK70_07210 [Clostridia bacterium]|nr:hypothetical protein [Clostridia bacterium]
MKGRAYKVYWGILMLIFAAALIVYGTVGTESSFGVPFFTMLMGIVLVGWIIAKIVFSSELREKFKIFIPLALLVMCFEKQIAALAGFESENFINNWVLLLSAVIADVAMSFIVPKRQGKGHNNRFSSSTHYVDAVTTKKSWINNRMGDSTVYYTNTDGIEGETFELNLSNSMGDITVHVPADWTVINELLNRMGDVSIRQNQGSRCTLKLMGDNKMGDINVVSP